MKAGANLIYWKGNVTGRLGYKFGNLTAGVEPNKYRLSESQFNPNNMTIDIEIWKNVSSSFSIAKKRFPSIKVIEIKLRPYTSYSAMLKTATVNNVFVYFCLAILQLVLT